MINQDVIYILVIIANPIPNPHLIHLREILTVLLIHLAVQIPLELLIVPTVLLLHRLLLLLLLTLVRHAVVRCGLASSFLLCTAAIGIEVGCFPAVLLWGLRWPIDVAFRRTALGWGHLGRCHLSVIATTTHVLLSLSICCPLLKHLLCPLLCLQLLLAQLGPADFWISLLLLVLSWLLLLLLVLRVLLLLVLWLRLLLVSIKGRGSTAATTIRRCMRLVHLLLLLLNGLFRRPVIIKRRYLEPACPDCRRQLTVLLYAYVALLVLTFVAAAATSTKIGRCQLIIVNLHLYLFLNFIKIDSNS